MYNLSRALNLALAMSASLITPTLAAGPAGLSKHLGQVKCIQSHRPVPNMQCERLPSASGSPAASHSGLGRRQVNMVNMGVNLVCCGGLALQMRSDSRLRHQNHMIVETNLRLKENNRLLHMFLQLYKDRLREATGTTWLTPDLGEFDWSGVPQPTPHGPDLHQDPSKPEHPPEAEKSQTEKHHHSEEEQAKEGKE